MYSINIILKAKKGKEQMKMQMVAEVFCMYFFIFSIFGLKSTKDIRWLRDFFTL